jgi:hypothetical protein
LPGRYRDVEDFFRRRGAYARFKELLAAEGCLDKTPRDCNFALEVVASLKREPTVS